MADTANLNIILSQGNAVNEVNNIRKQSLELNQQYVVQHAGIRKKKEKEEVPKPSSGSRIDVKNEKGNENRKEFKKGDPGKNRTEEDAEADSGQLIDIVV